MSEQSHESGPDPGRSSDRAHQDHALERASRQESWMEQLQRIYKQTKGRPDSSS
jgi:hypothetical protein